MELHEKAAKSVALKPNQTISAELNLKNNKGAT